MEVTYKLVATDADVRQILDLQQQNLAQSLSADAQQADGFVTVQHTFDILSQMNRQAPSVIATVGESLAGYCLMMPREFVRYLPILAELFEALNALTWHGERLRDNPRWFVMGQVAVAKDFRGMGIFDGLYRHLRASYRDQYDFAVTEIAARNGRSRRAHERVGFKDLAQHRSAKSNDLWHVVVLDL